MSDDTKVLSELIKATEDASLSVQDRQSHASKVGDHVKKIGVVKAFHEGHLIKTLTALLENKKQAHLREAALLILAKVSKAVGQAGEPYLIPLMPKVLDGYADKVASVRDAADEASKAIMVLPSRYAVKLLLPVLFDAIENGRWQSQSGSLQLLSGLSKTSPKVFHKKKKYISSKNVKQHSAVHMQGWCYSTVLLPFFFYAPSSVSKSATVCPRSCQCSVPVCGPLAQR